MAITKSILNSKDVTSVILRFCVILSMFMSKFRSKPIKIGEEEAKM